MGDDKVLNSKFLLHTFLRHNHAFDSTIFKLCEFAQFMINGKYFFTNFDKLFNNIVHQK